MPAITTNDLKNGITLSIENTLYTVVEFQHVKPGKGGAFVRTRLRNLKTGNMLDRTFNAGVRVEQAILQKSDMQFLYRDGEDYVFMDNQTYDQVNIHPVALGDAADYLVENAVAIIATHDDEIVSVEIPASVELEIANTEPGLQGDRVSGARKPATLQTGKTIQVPLFINVGDKVKVDTRSGEYITRV
ncbi:MAG: elongation factor P [Ilumatobacteraceae bacterium]